MCARYAIYYAPPFTHPLWRAGSAWLGRDALAGREMAACGGLDPALWDAATREPRFYGFHATIKAPFELAEGRTPAELVAALDAFSATRKPFALPLVMEKGCCARLVEALPQAEMAALHAEVLEAFDAFRAPLRKHDAARRLSVPLTERQRTHLDRWGYPFVLDAFRFHVTLTAQLAENVLAAVTAAAGQILADAMSHPAPVDGLCLFMQPDRSTPFRVLHRAAFGAS